MKKDLLRLLAALLLASPAAGQTTDMAAASPVDTPAAKSRWHVLIEPYLMFPHMNGNVDVGSSLPPSNLDLKPDDVFKNLQTGIMLYFEVSNDKWMISSDLMYMKLGQDVDSMPPILEGHADVKQLGWEVALLRKLNPWLSAGIGFQLNSVQSEVGLKLDTGRGPFLLSGDLTKTWVDPSLIVAVNLPLGAGNRWDIRGRGNIGGFGIGSKIYWQLQAYVDYHVSNLFQASIGYRAIKVDYESGSGSEYYMENLLTFGPVIRFGFNF